MTTGRAASGSRETTLGAVSMRCAHDYPRNLQRYGDFIADAAARGVDLLVFPEMSLHGYLMGGAAAGSAAMAAQLDYFRAVAEPIPGPSTRFLADHARRHHMLIQAGLAERAADGDALYNSAVLVGPSGVVGVFRKVHNQFEWPVFAPGDALPVFATPVGTIGMFICYDLCFPEVLRAFALQGAVIATLTTAWPMNGDDPAHDYFGHAFDLLSRANALTNQIWMVCANQVHRPPTPGCPDYFGHARIIAPSGEIVVQIGHAEGLVTASVDVRAGIEQARSAEFFGLNLLQDRRPALYGILLDQEIRGRSEDVPLPPRGEHAQTGSGGSAAAPTA